MTWIKMSKKSKINKTFYLEKYSMDIVKFCIDNINIR